MRSTYQAALAVLIATGSPVVAATNDQVRLGAAPDWAEPSEPLPVPEDASGLVFVRLQDTLVHLDGDGQSTYIGQRVKILHPQALQLGNVTIAWNPAAGAPTVHALRVYRDGAAINVLENAEFEVLRREDQLEMAMLDGMLTAVLRVPDLRVGDELEMAYTVPSHDPTMGSDSFGLLVLADSPAPGRFRLGLSWEGDEKPILRLTPDLDDIAEIGPNSLEILVDNPDTLTPPKDAPPRYSWQRIAEYSDFETWPSVSRRVASMFDAASRLSEGSPVGAEARRIAAAHDEKLEQAEAALDLVQEQVRYVYVGLNGGNYTPATAEETWRRRYGDCKGKSALLLALLTELGIEAEAVLANNSGFDDGLDERVPSPGLFDHVLVRATIDGETYWLDGTLPSVSDADTRPVIPYRWILPLSEAGSAIESIPFEQASLPLEMGLHEIDATAGFDEPGRITQQWVKRGIEGFAEYVRFSALTQPQLENAFRGSLVGSTQWDTVESVDYRYDRETQASVVSIVGTGPVDWDDMGDGEYQLVLPGGGFSPPDRRQRSPDQNADAPFYNAPSYSCYATTVRLPAGTELENWGFNSVYTNQIYGRTYYRMMERNDDDRTIRLVRTSRVEELEISPEQARIGNASLADFDNSKANITYDPATVMEPWGDLREVPATFEIDWTGAQPSCLPGMPSD